LLFGVALGATFLIWGMVDRELFPVVQHTNYTNIGVGPGTRAKIAHFVSTFISITLLTILCMALLFIYHPILPLTTVCIYLVIVIQLMKRHHLSTCKTTPGKVVAESQFPWEKPVAPSRFRERDRWKGL
jgi:fatty acid desaturase